MSRRKWYAVAVAVVLVAAVTLGLVFGLTGGGQQSTQVIQASLPSAGTPNEGIQVHGHWIIDVMNPDGSLASHNEFENAFTPEGRQTLANLLLGNRTAGPWELQLDDLSVPICKSSGNPNTCEVAEPTTSLPTTCDETRCDVFPNLSKSYTPAHIGPNMQFVPAMIKLNGSATASFDGNVSIVRSFLFDCAKSMSPDECVLACCGEYPLFTETTLGTPIHVLKDQQVLVEVDISFP